MNIRVHMRRALGCSIIVLVGACSGGVPDTDEAQVSIVEGQCRNVHGAEVCTWAEVEGDRVVRFGANVPMASVENAPTEPEMTWPPTLAASIPLPGMAQDQLGVQFVKIYWEAHGHPPGPYLVPHFDFHFYTIAPADVDAIDCSDLTKPATPPTGYALPDVEIPDVGTLIGLCVPMMGMHALLLEELESENTFTGTMVIGYYEEQAIFFEPMITKELLLERQTFALDFPSVPGDQPGVTLPTRFEAEYDEASSSYRFVFSGL